MAIRMLLESAWSYHVAAEESREDNDGHLKVKKFGMVMSVSTSVLNFSHQCFDPGSSFRLLESHLSASLEFQAPGLLLPIYGNCQNTSSGLSLHLRVCWQFQFERVLLVVVPYSLRHFPLLRLVITVSIVGVCKSGYFAVLGMSSTGYLDEFSGRCSQGNLAAYHQPHISCQCPTLLLYDIYSAPV